MLDWEVRVFAQENAFPLAYHASSTGCHTRRKPFSDSVYRIAAKGLRIQALG
jgi:hypothetical protein